MRVQVSAFRSEEPHEVAAAALLRLWRFAGVHHTEGVPAGTGARAFGAAEECCRWHLAGAQWAHV